MFDAKQWTKLADHYRQHNTTESLTAVRQYLDSVGMFMPSPRYQFRSEERSSWRFLDGRIHHDERSGITKYTNVYNHHFKYGYPT